LGNPVSGLPWCSLHISYYQFVIDVFYCYANQFATDTTFGLLKLEYAVLKPR